MEDIEIEVERWYYSKSGNILHEYPKLNGKHHGIQKAWHDNGNINYYTEMFDGQYQGLFQRWFDKGVRYEIYLHKDSNHHGPNIFFNYKNIIP